MDLTGNYDNEGYIDLMSQNLGFVINLKKSILQPVKKLEFLGLQINTEEMTLSLSEEKLTLLLLIVLLLKISKSVCHCLLSHGIIITAEYLTMKSNVQRDW